MRTPKLQDNGTTPSRSKTGLSLEQEKQYMVIHGRAKLDDMGAFVKMTHDLNSL
jgi:hypothetical protein